MAYRNFEKVRAIIARATNLEVVYAYEDLVFPDHTAFIIQFDDINEDNLFCYFHKDCIAEEQERLFSSLYQTCREERCIIIFSGTFELVQKGENVEILFSK